VALALGAFPLGAQQTPSAIAGIAPDGRSLYAAACAACHGAGGAGAERALVAFAEDVPDFTDCRFASREPAADWVIVAHEGGPVRAFSEMMPAFGDALAQDELERVVDYVKAFCRDRSWPDGALNLPRALLTEKAFPEDEAVLETEAGRDPASVLHTLVYEKRFGSRSQIELSVPFGYRRSRELPGDATSWSSGLGDVAIGVKHVLSHGLARGHILSVVGEVKLPTAGEGFGADATVFEAFLAFGKLLPSDAFLQMQAGAERSTAAGAETELFGALVAGRSLAQGFGRVWSPMIELFAAREGEEDVEWDVLPQLHVTLSRRQHVMLTLGPRIPLGDPERDPSFMVSLLWDWFDGGFLDGW
jgi:mono/diheme cytochrome c family protein